MLNQRLKSITQIQYISCNNLRGKKVQTIFKFRFNIISFILITALFTLRSESLAQNGLRIFDVPGGGSGSTQTQDSNDNTTIYVVGGLVIAGILAYALLFKEKKKDADTTASLNSNLIYSEVLNPDNAEENIHHVKDKMPVDIFLGIRNNEAVLNDRIYQVGLRVKL